jgi:hypothetical protein
VRVGRGAEAHERAKALVREGRDGGRGAEVDPHARQPTKRREQRPRVAQAQGHIAGPREAEGHLEGRRRALQRVGEREGHREVHALGRDAVEQRGVRGVEGELGVAPTTARAARAVFPEHVVGGVGVLPVVREAQRARVEGDPFEVGAQPVDEEAQAPAAGADPEALLGVLQVEELALGGVDEQRVGGLAEVEGVDDRALLHGHELGAKELQRGVVVREREAQGDRAPRAGAHVGDGATQGEGEGAVRVRGDLGGGAQGDALDREARRRRARGDALGAEHELAPGVAGEEGQREAMKPTEGDRGGDDEGRPVVLAKLYGEGERVDAEAVIGLHGTASPPAVAGAAGAEAITSSPRRPPVLDVSAWRSTFRPTAPVTGSSIRAR